MHFHGLLFGSGWSEARNSDSQPSSLIGLQALQSILYQCFKHDAGTLVYKFRAEVDRGSLSHLQRHLGFQDAT